HRDIKPANIFVPYGFPAKIMDFGVARLTGQSVTTTAGVVTGTPNYMSPEQFQGKEIDGRTDLFSLTLILFELVTGEKAFRSSDIAALFYKIVHEDVDLSLVPGESDWDRLRQVLARGLAKDRDERYPDARAMSGELSLALQDLGGSADLTAPADRILLVKPRPRSPTPIAEAVSASQAAAARPRGPAPAARPPQTPDRRSRRHGAAARSSSRSPLVLAGVLGTGALAMIVFAAWLALAPSRSSGPGQTPAPPDTGDEGTSAAPDTAPSPSATTAPTPVEDAPATPAPTPLPTPVPAPATPTPAPTAALSIEDRLLRADQFLQQGRFRQALDEARSVRREDPTNQEAIVIAQDAEAAIVVEECIKNASAALEAGDRDRAVEEIKRGFAIYPNDARLVALFRRAIQ
ncbi:MAG: protein kinase, partial [Vicinamibacteria bacterium]